MIAQIIINSTVKNLNRIFDYNIPSEFEEKIQIGSCVLIPFGRSKNLEEGFVIGIKEKSEYVVKDIEKIEENLITNQKIELAKWMSNQYFCNLSDCIKLMLPPGTTSKNIDNRMKEKSINHIYLKKDIEEIDQEIENKILKSEKQIRTLNFLKNNDGVLLSELEVFADTTRAIVKTLEKNGYLEIIDKKVERNPFVNKNIEKTEKLKLTKEQEISYKSIEKTIDDNIYEEFLIHGITGSGKTEIYLQLIEKIILKGKSAIVLVPEISLTPQMVDRFIARFGEDIISVLHSKLSVGERYDGWQKIKRGESKIIIGARSAIFAPVQNLGLIIIDEEHDSSYKSEMSPRYNAKDVARKIAITSKIPVILGSATPDINTYYKAEIGEIKLLELPERANKSTIPTIEIVDLRQELANGNRSMISSKLYHNIKENIENKKQTILFLNRRGFSTFIMCRECGYTLKCNNCNINLTYHKNKEKLKCHYCGYEQNNVKICPECNSDKIRYFGTGTQRLEQEVLKLFPEAKTIRMDIDTVTKKNSHEEILNKFKNDSIDILIGTQMIVKGHHFPNVTLVGVIAADTSLNIDDYRSNERTFALLVQVAGRAGREKYPGKVIIQTYNPDNYSIIYAQKQDYNTFYEAEISIRKQLKYPPFSDIILFGINGLDEKEIIDISNYLYNLINNRIKNSSDDINVFKPLPSPIDKIKNRYRWRMIMKCNLDEDIIKILHECLNEYYKKYKKNINTRVIIDINPISML